MALNRLDRLIKALSSTRTPDRWSQITRAEAVELRNHVTELLASPETIWHPRPWRVDTWKSNWVDLTELLHQIDRQVETMLRRLSGPGHAPCHWPREQVVDLSTALEAFLARVKPSRAKQSRPRPLVAPRPNSDDLMQEIITAGYRILAKRLHPDHGGSDKAMKELNEAVRKLRRR